MFLRNMRSEMPFWRLASSRLESTRRYHGQFLCSAVGSTHFVTDQCALDQLPMTCDKSAKWFEWLGVVSYIKRQPRRGDQAYHVASVATNITKKYRLEMPVLPSSGKGPLSLARASEAMSTTNPTENLAIRASGNGCPSGTVLSSGAIAGIVIGTIAGTLLVLWIIKSCFALGPPTAGLVEQPVVAKRHPSHSHRRRHRSRSRSQNRPVIIKEQMAQPQRAYYGYTDYDQSRGRR
jgi:hypothetical protein